MKHKLSFTGVLAFIVDVLGAILLVLYGLFIGPLGFLRGPIVIERAFWYFWVFAPLGLLAKSIRVAIEWRLGHFDLAISQAENLALVVEEHFLKHPHSNPRRRVLEDLYTLLTRAYLHTGHIDEAMQMVLRAKKNLGLSRLAGLGELDAKTAHLVRAGLAAGRLLEGDGLATMFVRTEPQVQQHNIEKNNATQKNPATSKKSAQIIPFPPQPH